MNSTRRHKIALAMAILWLLGRPIGFSAGTYPPPAPWQPDPAQREHLRRSLTLMAESTPEHRNTVRVLFYGQSITASESEHWWLAVSQYLRTTYPNANFIIENRAISGHSSDRLVKTAEADVYPFQPDLLIFHVYGSHIEYGNIFLHLRERTCADILEQTDHITKDESLTEETDPAILTPKQWDAWMNHAFLPANAAQYGACRADIHELWKTYLQDNHLKASALLRDGVHPNPWGDWLMGELIKPYLAPLPIKPGYDPFNASGVSTVVPPLASGQKTLDLQFTGNRVDLIFKPGLKGAVSVQVDGQKPSALPALYGFTSATPYPGCNWPLLLKVGHQSPLVAEEWSLQLEHLSPDGAVGHFQLKGSVTGQDGEGWSTNRFVSTSGRVVLEPEDWNITYCVAAHNHQPLPENQVITWQATLRGLDTAQPSTRSPGVEDAVTLAQGLPNREHTLRLQSDELKNEILAIRIYRPQIMAAK